MELFHDEQVSELSILVILVKRTDVATNKSLIQKSTVQQYADKFDLIVRGYPVMAACHVHTCL